MEVHVSLRAQKYDDGINKSNKRRGRNCNNRGYGKVAKIKTRSINNKCRAS